MEVSGVEIFADRQARTGLSALSGLPVESIADLPPWLVEIHLFRGSAEAEAFVAGLEAAGSGNALVHDWTPGTHASNRTVILGRLDTPRPEAAAPRDAVKVVEHRPAPHDSAAGAESHRRLLQERAARAERERLEAGPVSRAFPGAENAEFGRGWWRGSVGGFGLQVTWDSPGGPFRVSRGCGDLFPETVDVSEAIRLAVEAAGAEADLEEREIASKCDGPDGLAEAAALVARGYDAARKAVETAMHEAFVAATKMTASRRRFIEAGENDGVRLILHRGARKLRAGALEIGATEAGIMERMGWIARGRDGYAVTSEGIEAARAVSPKRAARA